MPNFNLSAQMNMPIPIPGTESGPQWAIDLNSCLAILDQHDHTADSGVQITPLGLDINSDLSFNGNGAISINRIVLSPGAAPSEPSSIFMAAGGGSAAFDLWAKDSNGVAIQLTKSGIVNSVASSLPGESYSAGTFIWKQGAGSTTPANFNIGAITLRKNVAATTDGITMSIPVGFSGNADFVLPVPPGSGSALMQQDSLGNVTSAVTPDNSTIEINSNSLRVKASSITNTQLAALSVATGNIQLLAITDALIQTGGLNTASIADHAVTQVKRAALGQQLSGSCSNFATNSGSLVNVTGLSVTITTTGRPVVIQVIPDGNSFGNVALWSTATGGDAVIIRGSTNIAWFQQASSVGVVVPVTAVMTIDPVGAGTYTYKVQVLGSGTLFYNAKLMAYEL